MSPVRQGTRAPRTRAGGGGESATFTFTGTVQRTAAPDGGAVLVRVDQVIECSESMARMAGHEVVLQTDRPSELKKGQEATFETVPVQFGDRVVLRRIKRPGRLRAGARRGLIATGVDPSRRRYQREVGERVQDADVVVSGVVATVRLPADLPSTRARSGRARSEGARPPRRPASEHDPKWREAVVEVEDVQKGTHGKRSIVVRFPSSSDVMWHRAPKFHPGQRGYFLLRRRAGRRGARRAKAVAEVYTALDPRDFQPQERAADVLPLLAAARPPSTTRARGRPRKRAAVRR
jgi:hypothetical protein